MTDETICVRDRSSLSPSRGAQSRALSSWPMHAIAIFVSVFLMQAVAAPQTEPPHDEGIIYGTVLNLNGQPASQIQISASPELPGGILPQTRTNAEGHFRLPVLAWGKYTVYADDPQAGYSEFSSGPSLHPASKHKKIADVALSPDRPQGRFDFVLPPKAGFLHIRLTNQRTGELIRDLAVNLRPAIPDGSLFFGHSDSRQPVLVPPGRRMLLHVRSQGFQEWQKSRGAGFPVSIQSGAHLTLAIALQPSN